MFLKKKKPPQIVGICGRVELVLFLGMIVLMEVASHRLSLTRLLTTGLLSLLGRGEILFLFNFCQPDKNALLWIQTHWILIRIWILGLCHQSLKKINKLLGRNLSLQKSFFNWRKYCNGTERNFSRFSHLYLYFYLKCSPAWPSWTSCGTSLSSCPRCVLLCSWLAH